MASRPPDVPAPGETVQRASARELLKLGMFVFGMDSLAYDELSRRMNWRHALSDRFMARAASQFVGPGDDVISMSGLLVPEIGGSYSVIERLIEMAATGDHWPLIDGNGNVLGQFRILSLEQTQRVIMAGGLARMTGFNIELERHDG